MGKAASVAGLSAIVTDASTDCRAGCSKPAAARSDAATMPIAVTAPARMSTVHNPAASGTKRYTTRTARERPSTSMSAMATIPSSIPATRARRSARAAATSRTGAPDMITCVPGMGFCLRAAVSESTIRCTAA